MTSGSCYKGILLAAVFSCLLYEALADCSDEGTARSCDQCYQTLSSFLMNTSDNKYHLRNVFFPPDTISPAFVTVTYQYDDMSIPNKTWYWSAGIFYFYQPLRVFRFTSLFFGPVNWLRSDVTITLPAECENASQGFMKQLTQMVGTVRILITWSGSPGCIQLEETVVMRVR